MSISIKLNYLNSVKPVENCLIIALYLAQIEVHCKALLKDNIDIHQCYLQVLKLVHDTLDKSLILL